MFPRPRIAVVAPDAPLIEAISSPPSGASGPIELTALTPAAASVAALRARRADGLLVDPAALGPGFWTLLEAVGAEMPDLGVVVLAARADLASRLRGLRLAADDWITLPAHPDEVLARIERSCSRRRPPSAPREPLAAGDLVLRPELGDGFGSRGSLGLTRRECELLCFLAGNGGRVLTRETIYERVWSYRMAPGDRSVDTFVQRLRAKLSSASPRWLYIHTHFGIGYRFEPEPVGPHPADSPVPRERPAEAVLR